MPDWPTVWVIVSLAVIPINDLAKIMVARLGMALGVRPGDIAKYQQATEDGEAE